MNHREADSFTFSADEKILPVFSPLFQQGVMMRIPYGNSIRTLLCDEFGISSEYVSGRIQTVFLNGKAVDDISSAMIAHGDTLALSAAMPGLVGAVFRSGGALAVFRNSITHQGEEKKGREQKTLVTVKFFNLLVREMAPGFLERGFLLTKENAEELIRNHAEELEEYLADIRKDGKEIRADQLRDIFWEDRHRPVFIRGKMIARKFPKSR